MKLFKSISLLSTLVISATSVGFAQDYSLDAVQPSSQAVVEKSTLEAASLDVEPASFVGGACIYEGKGYSRNSIVRLAGTNAFLECKPSKGWVLMDKSKAEMITSCTFEGVDYTLGAVIAIEAGSVSIQSCSKAGWVPAKPSNDKIVGVCYFGNNRFTPGSRLKMRGENFYCGEDSRWHEG